MGLTRCCPHAFTRRGGPREDPVGGRQGCDNIDSGLTDLLTGFRAWEVWHCGKVYVLLNELGVAEVGASLYCAMLFFHHGCRRPGSAPLPVSIASQGPGPSGSVPPPPVVHCCSPPSVVPICGVELGRSRQNPEHEQQKTHLGRHEPVAAKHDGSSVVEATARALVRLRKPPHLARLLRGGISGKQSRDEADASDFCQFSWVHCTPAHQSRPTVRTG